ncbi:MAG TPA: dienelactone hydrolase family protein [Candidatus Aphodousia faecigallinarum]|uniref:Dienelactone hydrolase family protein n=1 Tax=Candidatus Aphodousia faecigallinarum TaxID=2840677 RepID=A0A9D1LFZ0_9BURK|nr:dienelactone hydrolase family protein [Candidatus Aphodousia faecigallinarum]
MDTIIQEPLDDSHAPITLIWLHGMGVDGSDFESFQKELSQFGELNNVRMILPSAPSRDISAYNMKMTAWYDIYDETFDSQQKEDIDGMNQAADTISALIEEQRQKNPQSPIWLGGFSQGAALALLVGMSQINPVAGVIALSGYVPNHPRFDELSDVAKQTPIFMAHGTLDSVITIAQARAGLEILNKAGASVEFKDYPMMHEICPDELSDIAEFISAHSSEQPSED